ncbi:class I SAM-dependent methyltransferase [Dongia sp.]|uniref:class I SAM-dependent methyltransferase n=1 Tax=Dongia sp. TaxID=1977262 RepID=UPI0035AEBF50
MNLEDRVQQHYGDDALSRRVLAALSEAGKDIDRLTIDDLAAVDEFHLGWREQTKALAEVLELQPGERLLDIGCGIGGPARFMAVHGGCHVSGIDLTPQFVALARDLTRRCGLTERVDFKIASALAQPFAPATFDAAMLIHVGMNIADKARLFAEAHRVLKPGGRFVVYDVMAPDPTKLTYPMPWAADPAASAAAPPELYRETLAAAGFEIVGERDRSTFVRELAAAMRERNAAEGRPRLGLHLIMGEAADVRLKNVMAALEQGLIVPTEMIARAR